MSRLDEIAERAARRLAGDFAVPPAAWPREIIRAALDEALEAAMSDPDISGLLETLDRLRSVVARQQEQIARLEGDRDALSRDCADLIRHLSRAEAERDAERRVRREAVRFIECWIEREEEIIGATEEFAHDEVLCRQAREWLAAARALNAKEPA